LLVNTRKHVTIAENFFAEEKQVSLAALTRRDLNVCQLPDSRIVRAEREGFLEGFWLWFIFFWLFAFLITRWRWLAFGT
jgi:hypothetical protein